MDPATLFDLRDQLELIITDCFKIVLDH